MNWVRQLQREHQEWLASRYKGQDPKVPLLGIVGEAGEAAHALLSEHKELHHGKNPRHTEHLAAFLDALADCVIYTASWCNTTGWDLDVFYWDITSPGRERSLDLGHELVKTACDCYALRMPTCAFAGLVSAACNGSGARLEDIVMQAWNGVKERIR